GDQFDAHPNPQPGNTNGWVDDDDDDVEKEILLNLTRMERDKAERRLSESIRWNK
nr:hypothetical protein [Tanacetum cinerariifolium]